VLLCFYSCAHKVFVSMVQKMHQCWQDDDQSKRLCLDLMEKVESKNRYNAHKLHKAMNQVHKSIADRDCFCTCFRRAFLYTSINHNRSDLLTLLLRDKHHKLNSVAPCNFLSLMILQALEKGRVQTLLFGCEESPLTPALTDRLHHVISEDIQAAINLSS